MNFVSASSAIRDVSREQVRAAPKAAKVVLPVWGYKYARHFLTHGLPTLLAPGNIPALAQAVPTQFVLLTSLVDERYIRQSAPFRKLSKICPVEVRLIDHLITAGNSSTTITLAYTGSCALLAKKCRIPASSFWFLTTSWPMERCGACSNGCVGVQAVC